MTDITILTETDLRQLVPLDIDAVDCVANGFAALETGNVVMPPILSMAIEAHNGEMDVKTAYVPGLDSFCLKVSPGFFDNPKIGLPTTSGLMLLLSSTTGQIQSVLLDNGYLTNLRTAAAGAVAARHLAKNNASKACIIGAGVQAHMQLEAVKLVRNITSATLWARDVAKGQAAAAAISDALDLPVTAHADIPSAMTDAEVVITTTPSKSPLIHADWLEPGQTVIAMGSDQHDKCELDPACLTRADLYVPDRQSQTTILGELRPAIEAGLIPSDQIFPEIGALVAGTAPGRSLDDQIIIADLTGTGVQDTAIATFARQRAEAAGAGQIITT